MGLESLIGILPGGRLKTLALRTAADIGLDSESFFHGALHQAEVCCAQKGMYKKEVHAAKMHTGGQKMT